MATQSIPDQPILDNLPPHAQQAITAARAIEPQVNGRYLAAVNLVAAGAVQHNPAGGFDVLSRTTGQPYHINGASCTCKDAEYNAPTIAGRKACAHQVAAWIMAKADLLARQAQPEPTPVPVPAVELETVIEPALVPGRFMRKSHQPPAPFPAEPAPAVESAKVADDAGLPLATLLAAAAKAQGSPYELVNTHIGGHGDAAILRAVTENPQACESYLVDGDWKADRLHVCQWGRQFGQPDWQTTAKLQQAAQRGRMEPAMAYYLETTGTWVLKVMVTRGEQFPKVVKTFNTPDKLERAREFVDARVEAQLRGLRNASPTRMFEERNALLPETWRQRMGGVQIGKGWVIYAEAIEQPQEVAA